MNPLCRNGHPKNPDNTTNGRCLLCRALNSRRYRSEGRHHKWEDPDRKRKFYRANREKVLSSGRARYHANKAKYAAMRRINRLRKSVGLTDGEVQHLYELVQKVAAITTISLPANFRVGRGYK